jgi:hypothetical protein
MSELTYLKPGDEVDVFSREGTLHHWNRFAAVNDEFADHHMSDQGGQHEGFPAAFGMAPLEISYLHNMLRDWLDSTGRIVSIEIRLKNVFLRGRTITCHGEVTEIQEKEGERLVALNVWENDDHGTRLVTGRAQVVLTL